MKILLDENITYRAVSVLEKYNHDVIHVRDRLQAGESDKNVFQLAVNEQRVLITLNGKDFIIFIPPATKKRTHYGLVWLRGFQVTLKTYEEVMDKIGCFLLKIGSKIHNSYYTVKKSGNSYEITRRYPKESE